VVPTDVDHDHANDTPVEVVRLVYRVDFHAPRTLGEPPETMPTPATELHIDASADRLRARFEGPGWPVDAGSEARIRRDIGGAYVFDASGGRQLGPSMLAMWFQGGELSRLYPPAVAVRRAPPVESNAPGNIICALVAEWAGQRRDELEHRCGEGGGPLWFRVGPWRAERTAEVPVTVPRSAMRADHVEPPHAIVRPSNRAFLEPGVLARVPANRRRGAPPAPLPDAPTDGVRIVNDGPGRFVLLAQGMPLGWVDRGETATFVGLAPGEYLFAGLRPLGNLGMRPRNAVVPGEIRVSQRR
jgi:hypothetical protein